MARSGAGFGGDIACAEFSVVVISSLTLHRTQSADGFKIKNIKQCEMGATTVSSKNVANPNRERTAECSFSIYTHDAWTQLRSQLGSWLVGLDI